MSKIKTIVRQFCSLCLLPLLTQISSPSEAEPTFQTSTQVNVYVLRGRPQCVDVISADENGMTVAQLVKTQTSWMSRRREDFTPAFYQSRVDVAFQHWEDSVNFYTLNETGELTSTFGLNFSDYGPGLEPRRLPEEATLQRTLERPGLKEGLPGFIVEGRTYGINADRERVYPALFRKLLQELEPRLITMPHLRDLPIINTYGGKEGLIMYAMMGFEVVGETEAYGKKMYLLRASPNTVAKRIQRLPDILYAKDFPTPLTFRAGTRDLPVTIDAQGKVVFMNRSGTRTTVSHFINLAQDTNLTPSWETDPIIAAKGSSGIIIGDRPLYVSKLAGETDWGRYKSAIGSSIGFRMELMWDGSRSPKLMFVGKIKEDSQIYMDLWAKAGSRVEMGDVEGTPWEGDRIFETARPVQMTRTGEILPAGSRAAFRVDDRWARGSTGQIVPWDEGPDVKGAAAELRGPFQDLIKNYPPNIRAEITAIVDQVLTELGEPSN